MCKYYKCNKTQPHQHVHLNISDPAFNKYLEQNVDHNILDPFLEKGSKINYVLNIGEITKSLNYTFANYFGKGNYGRESGVIIESYFYGTLLDVTLPFKHQTIFESLQRGEEIHVLVYQRDQSDEVALGLPFENLLNKQSRSIDISHLNEELIHNIRTSTVQKIKQTINTRNHTVHTLETIKKLIDQNPHRIFAENYDGEGNDLTIEELQSKIFFLSQYIHSFSNIEDYVIIRMIIASKQLDIELNNKLFVKMLQKCGGRTILDTAIRFKKQFLTDKTIDELNNDLNSIEIKVGSKEINQINELFNQNLKEVLLDRFNTCNAIRKTFDEHFILNYLFQLEFIDFHQYDGHINLRTDENRYDLIERVFVIIGGSFSLSYLEFQNWIIGHRKFFYRKQLEICRYVDKQRCKSLSDLIDHLREEMLNELLYDMNQVMPSQKLTTGVLLAFYYLRYLELKKRELRYNMFVSLRRINIIRFAVDGMTENNLTRTQMNDLIRNIDKNAADSNLANSTIQYLKQRINFIKKNVRSQNEFNLIKKRVEACYKEEIRFDKEKAIRRGNEQYSVHIDEEEEQSNELDHYAEPIHLLDDQSVMIIEQSNLMQQSISEQFDFDHPMTSRQSNLMQQSISEQFDFDHPMTSRQSNLMQQSISEQSGSNQRNDVIVIEDDSDDDIMILDD